MPDPELNTLGAEHRSYVTSPVTQGEEQETPGTRAGTKGGGRDYPQALGSLAFLSLRMLLKTDLAAVQGWTRRKSLQRGRLSGLSLCMCPVQL